MNKMIIIPASAAVAEGLTFTVGQITWTTRGSGLTTMTLEETQIQSGTAEASTPITPTQRARPPLPRYKAKRVDNSDLLQALDRADHKLLEASNLVDSISRKPDQATRSNFTHGGMERWPHDHKGMKHEVKIMVIKED
jgi:hypothetical protein